MTSERWFRRLLRLLPFDFRADYGDEMTRVFEAERRAAVGRADLLRVWFANLAALAAIGPREHLAQLGQDVRYALRSMRGNAGFVAAAVLTLALGIGANTAVFSIVDAVLLRPLPYAEPETLVAVWNRWIGSPAATLSNPEYLDYAEQSQSMTIAAGAAANVNVGAEGGDPERVPAAFVTVKRVRRAWRRSSSGPFVPCRGGSRRRATRRDSLRRILAPAVRGRFGDHRQHDFGGWPADAGGRRLARRRRSAL